MSPSDGGHIGEQNTAYRRGLVLGLTMAEVGILIIFVLLLLIALSAVARERERRLIRVEPGRYQEMQSAESALKAMAQSLGIATDVPPEEIARLVRVVQEASQTGHGQTALVTAKQALSDIERARADMQAMLDDAGRKDAGALADALKDKSFQLSNKEGQLKYAESRLATIGQGKGERPCWAEPDGSIQFLYDVVLVNDGIRMRERQYVQRAQERQSLPAPVVEPTEILSETEFLQRTRPLYLYGQRAANLCRFFVVIYDGTDVSAKVTYKNLLRTVEGHFYKRLANESAPF